VRTTNLKLKDMRITRNGWIAYGLALAVIAIDQLSKQEMLKVFVGRCGRLVLVPMRFGPDCRIGVTPFFDLSMIWNPGMSFGFLNTSGSMGRWFLTVFALLVAGGLAWWVRNSERLVFTLAAGLLIGGSIGNVIDRFHYGAVVDFLDFSRLGFRYIFNVADSGVTVGAALLLIEAFWPSVRGVLPRWRDRLRSLLASMRVRGN
jgi:signal peptidase II